MIRSTLRRPALLTIVLSFVAFISLGLPDGLLGVAWPSIRADFGLPRDALGALLLTGTLGYMFSSFNSGRLIARFGVGLLLAGSCLLTGGALIGYMLAPGWPLFVLIGLAGGAGGGAIDAGLNTYIAANHGPRLMQWLHASFGVGTTSGPLIMTAVLTSGEPWRLGYLIVGVGQLLLATCFFLTSKSWQQSAPQANGEKNLTEYKTPYGQSLRRLPVWLSMVMFVLYTGAEVTVGQWSFSLLTESRGFPVDQAGVWVSVYWGAFTVGRVLAGVVAGRVAPLRLLALGMGGACVGAVLLWWSPLPEIGLIGIALTGFSFAPIFPALVTTTADRVGAADAANTIGFQMSAASVGFVTVAGFAGVLAQRVTLEALPPYVLLCLLVLVALHTLAFRRPRRVALSAETAG